MWRHNGPAGQSLNLAAGGFECCCCWPQTALARHTPDTTPVDPWPGMLFNSLADKSPFQSLVSVSSHIRVAGIKSSLSPRCGRWLLWRLLWLLFNPLLATATPIKRNDVGDNQQMPSSIKTTVHVIGGPQLKHLFPMSYLLHQCNKVRLHTDTRCVDTFRSRRLHQMGHLFLENGAQVCSCNRRCATTRSSNWCELHSSPVRQTLSRAGLLQRGCAPDSAIGWYF